MGTLDIRVTPVPAESRQTWQRCIDTALASPNDINSWEKAPLVGQATYVVKPRSVVLLALALQEAAEASSHRRQSAANFGLYARSPKSLIACNG